MALTFKGTSIPGIHGGIRSSSPETQTTRTVTSGLRGESQLRGEISGCDLFVNVTLFNGYSTANACHQAIQSLYNLKRSSGSLVESGNRSITYTDVVLDDVEIVRDPFPCAGASTVGTFTGWMAELQLRFRRLRP